MRAEYVAADGKVGNIYFRPSQFTTRICIAHRTGAAWLCRFSGQRLKPTDFRFIAQFESQSCKI
jgi:hypothetical protein